MKKTSPNSAHRGASLPPTPVPPRRPGPVGGARDRNRRERVRKLAEAALGVFAETGLQSARIEDITARAGMSKGLFYRYFRNKEHLVRYLFTDTAAQVLPAFRACAERIRAAEAAEDLVTAYLPLMAAVLSEANRSPATLRLYLAERRAPGVDARRPIAALSTWVREGARHLTEVSQEQGWLDRDSFVGELSTIAVSGAVEELLYHSLHSQVSASPAEVVQRLTAMVYGGILRGTRRPE